MQHIPRENILAGGLGLINEGFPFIMNRRIKHKSDIFKMSILGFDVICFGGEDAAKTFYDPQKFVRKGAVPPPIQNTLTGKNAIHTRDAHEHQHRKAMFMSLLNDGNIGSLQDLVREELAKASAVWETIPRIVLFREAAEVLAKAICRWAGIPVTDEQAVHAARSFVAMVDAYGSLGSRNIRGRKARKEMEKWISAVISDLRSGKLEAEKQSAVYVCAHYRDTKGNLLDIKMAAVELLNILRPTVAISWYVTFAVLALRDYPECRQKMMEGEDEYLTHFINEVRRFYPFAPFMGARVKKDFQWREHRFAKGSLVLLDMYGTNHDPRLWEEPFSFNPDRFAGRYIKPFDFLAQGGGDARSTHRCPGELITVETLKTFLIFLIRDVRYQVPEQDLSYSLARMPTMPQSGFIMEKVKMNKID
ncbi:MAG: cytochrome P450 [Arcticibacter sp.]